MSAYDEHGTTYKGRIDYRAEGDNKQKLKQINEIAVKTLKDIAICRPALNKIKELSE
ncbi:hypothetical protein LCGC14_1107380 [marine sediment metagenome]|uniref:Uncharacterized protein n=1 Tax=marine sediment metagenome TaxID=412755 RepID=A0A0F9MCG2_9ZZZZ